MKSKGSLVTETTSTVLSDSANLKLSRNLVEDEVVDDIEQFQKSTRAGTSKPKATPSAASGASSSGASSSVGPAAPTVRERLSFKGYKTPDAPKAFLPKVPGCRWQLDDVRFHRDTPRRFAEELSDRVFEGVKRDPGTQAQRKRTELRRRQFGQVVAAKHGQIDRIEGIHASPFECSEVWGPWPSRANPLGGLVTGDEIGQA